MTATTLLPRWATATFALPLRVAQMREDAAVDVRLAVRQRTAVGAPIRALVTASGGCTAAALAATGALADLHLVDPNPAQLALARLKLHLLAVADPGTRSRILGHAYLSPALRAAALTALYATLRLPGCVFGPPPLVAAMGPDHVGRYEQHLVALRRSLPATDVAALLVLADPAEQARRVAPGTVLGDALDAAFDDVFAQPNLVALFGPAATRVEPLARLFAARTRLALAALPAAADPYVWQLLAGAFPPGTAAPWLTATRPQRLPGLAFVPSSMDEFLRSARPGAYDFVHLSTVLDWLPSAAAAHTLRLTHASLRRGGVVVIRQLDPALDVRVAAGAAFEWEAIADRSVLCRGLYVGTAR